MASCVFDSAMIKNPHGEVDIKTFWKKASEAAKLTYECVYIHIYRYIYIAVARVPWETKEGLKQYTCKGFAARPLLLRTRALLLHSDCGMLQPKALQVGMGQRLL